MAEKVKIFAIAKRIGIKSAELVEICQRAGYKHIKHHSNAVEPAEAEEIRKTAIKLYKPKEEPAKKKKAAQKKAEPKAKAAVEVEKKPKEKKKAKAVKEAPKAAHAVEEAAAPLPPKPGVGRGEAAVRRRARQVWAEARRAAVAAERVEPPAQAPSEAVEERVSKPKVRPKTKTPSRRRTVVFKRVGRPPPVKERETKIELAALATVRELSEKLGVGAGEIIKRLMLDHKVLANINETIDHEVAELIGLDYGVEITFKAARTAETALKELVREDRPEELKSRPPVVTLMGHVDHGKTTILDRIRRTEVAGSEDGGITQDIGAWQITYRDHVLTFVDTPGHEAFTAMRAHGAQVTDVVILVVAAEDGVMPQTEEAISHARAAGVPIIVALNKIDKPDANPVRVRQQLAAHDLNPEEWGGAVGCVDLSALTGQGVDELIERIILEAEILELKANPDRAAEGAVLEARMEEGRGVVANVVVRTGTLKPGDIVLCGPAYGRVRSLLNDRGEEIRQASPSFPVSISGLNRLPGAGDGFLVLEDAELARNVAEERFTRLRGDRLRPRAHVTLENLYERLAAGREGQLRMILKADVEGSLEPLVESFKRLGTEEVSVRLLHQGVGNVNVSDVLLADASDAVIFGFRVGAEERAGAMAKERGVEIRYYRIIYEAIQAVRNALEGLLKPELREEQLGVVEVRQLFRVSRLGNIAGCFVREGTVSRSARIRLMRGREMIHEGTIASLRRGKDDVREVGTGYECGIKLQGTEDIEVGDTVECFTVGTVKRTLH